MTCATSGPGGTPTWRRPKGVVEVNGVRLEPRDGAAIKDELLVSVKALEDAEVVLVDAA